MANYIQRPRLFSPANAFQQGQLARNQYEAGQISNQANRFNLQQAQQMAPIYEQQELAELKSSLQKMDITQRNQVLETANRVRAGIDAYLSNPDPNEYTAFRSTISSITGDDADLPEVYDPNRIKLARDKLDWELGEVQRNLQLTEIGVPGGQSQRAWVDPSRPDYVQPIGSPYAKKPLVQVGQAVQPPTIPPVLLKGLSPQISEKASAAYTAAGGGKDGLIAANKVIDMGTTQERRNASANILRTAFPQASPAELQQMQGTMDAAKDNQAGLKAATSVREEQRRLKKAKGFQERALTLLDKIMANPELNDVLGSVEGSDEGYLYGNKYRSDKESEAIEDIKELESILTADNLKLMTGVLSESDLLVLMRMSSGALNRKRGELRFREDARTLKEKLSSQIVQTVDDRQSIPPSGRLDGKLHVDAQGNRAWVYPDGSYEEVP